MQGLDDVSTVQIKQMIRKAEYEILVTGNTPYGQRYKTNMQVHLDELCKELGTREEC